MTTLYRDTWHDWEPEVIETTLHRDGHTLAEPVFYKIIGLTALILHPNYWLDHRAFSAVTGLLMGRRVQPIDDHSVAEMLVSAAVASWVYHKLQRNQPPFSEDVLRFCAGCAIHHNTWVLPPPLDGANAFTARKAYHCNDCGNTADVKVEDGHCDVCSHRYDATRVISNFGAKTQAGTNIEYFVRNPTRPVFDILERVGNGHELPDTADGLCAGRVMVALRVLTKHLKAREGL